MHRWTPSMFVLASLATLSLAACGDDDGGTAAQSVSRVSVASSGAQGDDDSGLEFPGVGAVISDNGRFVAFSSVATNLVANDTNDAVDVFVHDRLMGATERVSLDSTGAQADAGSGGPSISADGRFVAFASQAGNLVPDDLNEALDVFVHDRETGLTERVSVGLAGAESTGLSTLPALSGDGRYVAFASRADNLVPGDDGVPNYLDIFLHDRQSGTTQRVTRGFDGTPSSADSVEVAISADGRFVAFFSYAPNLVPNDTNDTGDIFVYDRQTGSIERASVGFDGAQANAESYRPRISADGRFVIFDTSAGNLVPADTNDNYDVFVRDRIAGTTELVSLASDGTQGNEQSFFGAISADGQIVAFQSLADNVVPDDTNETADVFVHDRTTGITTLVSIGIQGEQASSASFGPGIDADGHVVAFVSFAADLVRGDTNERADVFVRSLAPAFEGN